MVEDNLVAIMLGYEPPKQAPVLLKRGMGTQVRVTGVRSFLLQIKASMAEFRNFALPSIG